MRRIIPNLIQPAQVITCSPVPSLHHASREHRPSFAPNQEPFGLGIPGSTSDAAPPGSRAGGLCPTTPEGTSPTSPASPRPSDSALPGRPDRFREDFFHPGHVRPPGRRFSRHPHGLIPKPLTLHCRFLMCTRTPAPRPVGDPPTEANGDFLGISRSPARSWGRNWIIGRDGDRSGTALDAGAEGPPGSRGFKL